jgi:hypothetical protein
VAPLCEQQQQASSKQATTSAILTEFRAGGLPAEKK